MTEELPSGAVTFVFTDIEGSTDLVRGLRDRYATVLAEHQRLLREAFANHDGHEIDTQGDAFFYAFGSAQGAVLAAVEAQRALFAHPWPDGNDVKVRMGVHTGQAAPADGRYTGLAVHRAARICDAGHGGQILASQSTQSLLEDEEDVLEIRLLDLGDQRLKDIERPVRLFQIAAPGLPAEFPPPRGDEPERDAVELTPAPLWRRRPVILGAAGLLLGLVAAALVLATRDTGGGLSGVRPNHVGVIDPETNAIVDEIQVGLRPGPVAVGGGFVWVGNLDERTLTKIDSRQRVFERTFDLDNQTPTGIAVGADAVWIAHGASGTLSRVDPEFGLDQTLEVAGEALGSDNGSVAFGEGAVWGVFGDSTLARINPNPQSVEVTERTFVPGAAPAGIVVESGFLWVVNTDSSTVDQYDPRTFDQGTAGPGTSVGSRPTAIAAADSVVWVANTGSGTVTRLDPGTPPTTEQTTVGDSPVGVAVGAGAVWVANRGDGAVSRLDLATGDVETIEIGNAPAGIAFGDGMVWVSVQSASA